MLQEMLDKLTMAFISGNSFREVLIEIQQKNLIFTMGTSKDYPNCIRFVVSDSIPVAYVECFIDPEVVQNIKED